MPNQTCMLCGLPLSVAPTNKEHYVPQVLIRNFDKLGVPKTWTHALRANRYGAFSNSQILPIERHREWATVEVHERCNLDASPMCQDLKWWIDHPDEFPNQAAYGRIAAYYANLWRCRPEQIGLGKNSLDLTDYISGLAYKPGSLSVGWMWIGVAADGLEVNDRHYHTIYFGTEKALKEHR